MERGVRRCGIMTTPQSVRRSPYTPTRAPQRPVSDSTPFCQTPNLPKIEAIVVRDKMRATGQPTAPEMDGSFLGSDTRDDLFGAAGAAHPDAGREHVCGTEHE